MKTAETSDFESIVRYLEALLNSFPSPMSQTQLAKESNVSKAAITKVKDRLFEICDDQSLIYKRKLVLKKDSNTFGRIINSALRSGHLHSLIDSPFFKQQILDLKLHQNFSKSIPFYSTYFSEEDTNLLINLAISIIYEALPNEDELYSTIKDRLDDGSLVISAIMSSVFFNLEKLISSDRLVLQFRKYDLKRILTLRDKVYFFANALFEQFVSNLKIVSDIKRPEQREGYIMVYKETFDFYLKHYLEQFSNVLLVFGPDSHISETDLDKFIIGSYFSPGAKVDVSESHKRRTISKTKTSDSGKIELKTNPVKEVIN